MERRLRLPDDLQGRGGDRMTVELSESQALAVEQREGSMLVSANAGSGKTTVLAERYLRSVLEDGLTPGQILAISFTDKAAGELRQRVRRLLMQRGGREQVRSLENGWISTFHGACARILRTHAVQVGIDPQFVVLDESEARMLRAAAFDTALTELMAGAAGPELDLIAAYGVDRLQTVVTGAYAELRSRGERSPRLPGLTGRGPQAPDTAALERSVGLALSELDGVDGKTVAEARASLQRLRDLLDAGDVSLPGLSSCLFAVRNTNILKDGAPAAAREELQAVIRGLEAVQERAALRVADTLLDRYGAGFEQAKQALGALDFEDLQLRARDLLRDSAEIRHRYRARFKAIMVDEFQDTNRLQLDILDLLGSERFVVGDALQSIYGFRHADVTIFKDEREHSASAGGLVLLADNYRTHPEILGVIDTAFAAGHGADHVDFEAKKESRPADGPLTELLLIDRKAIEAAHDDDAPEDPLGGTAWRCAEARLVAERVAELVAGGQSPGDIAMLLRALTDLHVYEGALEEQGVPTVAAAGGGYWGRTHVLDLCAYLATLANPADELALFGLLASPLVGISSDGLAVVAQQFPQGSRWPRLADAFTGIDDGPLSELLSGADRALLQERVPWVAAERSGAPRRSLATLIERVVDVTDYDLHVLALPGGVRRLANIEKLTRLAADYEARHGRDLRGFVDHAKAELEAGDREPDAPVSDAGGSAVRLMSIHASKGLEFPIVVVPDLSHRRAAEASEMLIGSEWSAMRVRTLDGYSEPSEGLLALRDLRRVAELSEERRIFHVAMTRAQERLILAASVTANPDNAPSGWIVPELVPNVEDLLDGDPEQDRSTHVLAAGGVEGAPRVAVTICRNAPAVVGLGSAVPARPTGHAVPQAEPEPLAQMSLDEISLPVLPPVDHGVLPTISYSSLSRFSRCSYRFHLERELRLPENSADPLLIWQAKPGGEGTIDPASRGSIVHAALERADLRGGACAERSQLQALAAELVGEISEDAIDDLVQIVDAALTAPLMARIAAAQARQTEVSFVFDLGGDELPLLNGTIDLLATEPGGAALVVDYKTDRVRDGDDVEDLVAARYSLQRQVYAAAVLAGGIERVDVAYLFTERPEQPAIVSYTQADLAGLRTVLSSLCHDLRFAARRPTSDPGRFTCAGCPARLGLCPYSDTETSR